VIEFRIKPGITAASVERGDRVIYNVKGGTLLRTYPDGKTDKIVLKTGDTRWVEKATFGFKNVGKTEIVQVVVFPK
jgi:hypothetical protein